jgi:hypothetical protein
MELSRFYEQISFKKIEINWNESPIEMGLFLSFLTVPVVIIPEHFGSDTGWTLRENKELNLKIKGGVVGRTEYLNSIQFGDKLQNRYNNYCNPFYLFDILTDEGKRYFVDYYKDEIEALLNKANAEVLSSEKHLQSAKDLQLAYLSEVNKLRNI